jgi:hypothetical protein
MVGSGTLPFINIARHYHNISLLALQNDVYLTSRTDNTPSFDYSG